MAITAQHRKIRRENCEKSKKFFLAVVPRTSCENLMNQQVFEADAHLDFIDLWIDHTNRAFWFFCRITATLGGPKSVILVENIDFCEAKCSKGSSLQNKSLGCLSGYTELLFGIFALWRG
jgi:hypothetical protein